MKRRDFIKIGGASLVSAFALQKTDARVSDFEETIIIGTGYGATVAALRLAQNDFRSVMIEMGKDWHNQKEPFSKLIIPKKQSTWLKKHTIAPFGNLFGIDKYTGVFDRVDFDDVKFLRAEPAAVQHFVFSFCHAKIFGNSSAIVTAFSTEKNLRSSKSNSNKIIFSSIV